MVARADTLPSGPELSDLGLNGYTRPERYFAAIFDNFFAFLIMMCVAVALSENIQSSKSGLVNAIVGFGVGVLYFAYFLMFESIISSTPGKLIFSLRVQHLNGTKCSFRAAVIRTLTRFIEVNPFFFGCLPAAIVVRCSGRNQRWGDLLANTIVTDKK